MDKTQIAVDGKVNVRATACDHCLFSKDRLVSGAQARDIIRTTRDTDGASFICHRGQVSDEPDSVCRTWFDKYAAEDMYFRLAIGLDLIREV